jgi:signal-transduction protein with cAMP-binding, CBS, and nucleotidyltransferase domain
MVVKTAPFLRPVFTPLRSTQPPNTGPERDHFLEPARGAVSERNVVSAISQYGGRALTMTVKDIFTQTSISVAPEDSIKKAMSLMTIQRLRQLPVIADGRLVGIISIGDVVKHRLEDLETESNILRDLYVAAR